MNAPTPPVPRTSPLAISSLILGLLSVLLGPLTGVPAIITGHLACSRIKTAPSLSGRPLAITGLVLGYAFSVLIVVAIALAIAAAFSSGFTEVARGQAAQAAQSKLNGCRAKLEMYEALNGHYPTTEQGLQALVTKPTTAPSPPRWRQMFPTLPLDPWGNEIFYTFHPATDSYSLASPGPDGVISTPDDVTFPP